jgi:hypothetical protein
MKLSLFELPLMAYRSASKNPLALMKEIQSALQAAYPGLRDLLKIVHPIEKDHSEKGPRWEIRTISNVLLVWIRTDKSPGSHVKFLLYQLVSDELHNKIQAFITENENKPQYMKGPMLPPSVMPEQVVEAKPIKPDPIKLLIGEELDYSLPHGANKPKKIAISSKLGAIAWEVWCSDIPPSHDTDYAVGMLKLGTATLLLNVVRCYGVHAWICTFIVINEHGKKVEKGMPWQRNTIERTPIKMIGEDLREVVERISDQLEW